MLAASILNVISKYIKGKDDLKAAGLEVETLIIQNLHQLAIADSKSKWRYVAFVRPTFGWVVVIGYAYMLLVGPLVESFYGFPQVQLNETAITSAAGLFGIHQIGRSWEKKKGLTK